MQGLLAAPAVLRRLEAGEYSSELPDHGFSFRERGVTSAVETHRSESIPAATSPPAEELTQR
jgi:hypothetical protein